MNRPTQDEYFLSMAKLAGSRSNCLSRQVGCVLVDKKDRVLSTGYNGVPRKFKHCTEGSCPRLGAKSGQDLDKCLAIHAEQNALMFCKDIDRIDRAYITVSPCLTCAVMLMNTSCKHIIFGDIYDEKILQIWHQSGRSWTHANANVSSKIGLGNTQRISEPVPSLNNIVRHGNP